VVAALIVMSTPARTTPRAARPDAQPTLIHAIGLAAASLISYTVIMQVLVPIHSVSPSDDELGALWSVVATIFVYRDTSTQSLASALSRMAATSISFVLCGVYLALLAFHPWGMALLIGAGVIIVSLLRRPDDAITTAITTAVVLIVASSAPGRPWEQPILRFVDTLVGVVVGIAAVSLGTRAAAALSRN
jgi:uncharacterized membrane protein YccC